MFWKEIYESNSELYNRWRLVKAREMLSNKNDSGTIYLNGQYLVAAGQQSIRIWNGINPKLEPDGVFSIGKKYATKINILQNNIIATCSDGIFRSWNLDQPLGAIDQPDQATKISKKSLVSLEILKDMIIMGDIEGVVYLGTMSEDFDVSMKKKIHKGPVTSIISAPDPVGNDDLVFTSSSDYTVKVLEKNYKY